MMVHLYLLLVIFNTAADEPIWSSVPRSITGNWDSPPSNVPTAQQMVVSFHLPALYYISPNELSVVCATCLLLGHAGPRDDALFHYIKQRLQQLKSSSHLQRL